MRILSTELSQLKRIAIIAISNNPFFDFAEEFSFTEKLS